MDQMPIDPMNFYIPKTEHLFHYLRIGCKNFPLYLFIYRMVYSKGVIVISIEENVNRRFIRYMANLIYYNSINHDKRRRLMANRYPLTLDNNENLESALITVYDPEPNSPDLKDHITDPTLYKAYESLSEQQQKILSLAFIQNLNDKEIAKLLGGSQQNISKHRLKALAKLRRLLPTTEEGEDHNG
ncbi:sigma-70 family RNA polymerase sigma factor [Paenibacillus sp. Y412MC10]|uniref:sigma-70 family RNA polymerase sigma factor n=1 Tax=Geobacillus sp. (strain Y412MC10) TaxID=481743 RepID=UPI0011AB3130|nr:sigma-70 family RNA polymerase sigma factor [Paenibacillus sp. Y412MC10]